MIRGSFERRPAGGNRCVPLSPSFILRWPPPANGALGGERSEHDTEFNSVAGNDMHLVFITSMKERFSTTTGGFSIPSSKSVSLVCNTNACVVFGLCTT